MWLVAKLRGCKIIIDWHNLGWSILALRLGQEHPFVKVAKWYVSCPHQEPLPRYGSIGLPSFLQITGLTYAAQV